MERVKFVMKEWWQNPKDPEKGQFVETWESAEYDISDDDQAQVFTDIQELLDGHDSVGPVT